MIVDPNLPCGYCCGAGPLCGSDDPEHDDMTCNVCLAFPLSAVHPECQRMVDAYMAELRANPY